MSFINLLCSARSNQFTGNIQLGIKYVPTGREAELWNYKILSFF